MSNIAFLHPVVSESQRAERDWKEKRGMTLRTNGSSDCPKKARPERSVEYQEDLCSKAESATD